MDEKQFSLQVLLEEFVMEVPTVVINGVPQQSTSVPVTKMMCPTCGREILSFNQGVRKVDILKAICEDESSTSRFKEMATYCPECGQKLAFDFLVIDSQDYSVTETLEGDEQQ